MKRERDFSKRWIKSFLDLHKHSFIFKMPDSPILRKPFDAFAFVKEGDKATAYAIEFKMISNDLTSHQLDALKRAAGGGAVSLVIFFSENGDVEKVERINKEGLRSGYIF